MIRAYIHDFHSLTIIFTLFSSHYSIRELFGEGGRGARKEEANLKP